MEAGPLKGKDITQELCAYFEVTAINCKPRHGKPPVFSDEQLSSLKMPVVFIGGKDDILVNTKKSLEKLSQNVNDLKSRYICSFRLNTITFKHI